MERRSFFCLYDNSQRFKRNAGCSSRRIIRPRKCSLLGTSSSLLPHRLCFLRWLRRSVLQCRDRSWRILLGKGLRSCRSQRRPRLHPLLPDCSGARSARDSVQHPVRRLTSDGTITARGGARRHRLYFLCPPAERYAVFPLF